MVKFNFKNITFIFYFSLIFVLPEFLTNKCSNINNHVEPKYKLIKRHSRSRQIIILQRNVPNLKACKAFAVSRKALAFNFYQISNNSRSKIRNNTNKNNDYFNCQALDCPDIFSFASLTRDKKFNYYSLYPRKVLPDNSSNENYSVICLPSVGLFIISNQHKNYSEAKQVCKSMHGVLAHIVSAERTQGLSKFINVPTFVGLSRRGKERTWINEFDEPLSCFDYRAWAKGEPSISRGCTTLVQIKENPPVLRAFWRVASCSRVLPFICEILPSNSRQKNH